MVVPASKSRALEFQLNRKRNVTNLAKRRGNHHAARRGGHGTSAGPLRWGLARCAGGCALRSGENGTPMSESHR